MGVKHKLFSAIDAVRYIFFVFLFNGCKISNLIVGGSQPHHLCFQHVISLYSRDCSFYQQKGQVWRTSFLQPSSDDEAPWGKFLHTIVSPARWSLHLLCRWSALPTPLTTRTTKWWSGVRLLARLASPARTPLGLWWTACWSHTCRRLPACWREVRTAVILLDTVVDQPTYLSP